MIQLLTFMVVFAFMLIEARRAERNERTQRARGGIEPGSDVYGVMQFAYPLSFLALIVEGALRGAPPPGALAAGAALFAASKALKWWAITSLGRAWTFRVIVVPGDRLVRSGPYRFMRHPNYIAVAGELASTALVCNARLSGPVAVLGFSLLMLRRIAVEERAIAQMAGRAARNG